MTPVTARGRTSPMLPWSARPWFYMLASIVCWVSSASAAKLNLGRDARQLQDGAVESEVTAGFVEILTDDGRPGCCRTGGGEEQHYQNVAAADSLTQCEADCAARGLCLGYEWCETRPPGVLWSMSIAPRPLRVEGVPYCICPAPLHNCIFCQGQGESWRCPCRRTY